MSDLLNQASLVMVPSGYKEDTVYSVVPSDGSGDLSFTRASNGTRVNSAGLVEVAPWNYKIYSEDLTNGVGLQTSTISTITANTTDTTDPFGTNKATKFDGSSGQLADTYNPIPENSVITSSIYAKAGSVSTFILRMSAAFGTNAQATFNLSSGTITATSGDVYLNSTITSVGNGWYRCSITYNFNSIPTNRILLNANGSLYFFGWQLNIGSTAKPYFPTTDRLNVPRLTYQNGGGGCPSLLLEKQSTNVATQSTITSFGSGTNDWLNGAGSPASINQTTGIDGTQNGTKYTRTAGQTTDDYFYKNTVPVTSGTTYTVSGYIKLGTAANAVVVINNTSAWNSVPNGSIVCSTANGFSTTAWKRFELTITGPSTNQINIHYGYHQETGVTAQATGTFFLDGLQVEASSYATSLIPTTSSSATRVADACFKTGISSLIGQTEGVLFADVVPFENVVNDLVSLNLSVNNSVAITMTNSIIRGLIFNSGNVFTISGGSYTKGNRYKIAVVYKNNNSKIFVNGALINSNSANVVFSGALNDLYNYPTDYYEGANNIKFNSTQLYKTALTDAECIALTTL